MDAAQYTIENGGGTFRASDLTPVNPTSGFAVGITDGTATKFSLVGAGNATYLQSRIAEVSYRYPNAPYIGTWIDDEKVCHIDPVVILHNPDDAVAVGRAMGQLAIYDFETWEAHDL